VQKLFSLNKGTNVLSITTGNETMAGKNGLYASAVADNNTKDVIIKVVNTGDKEQSVVIEVPGVKKASAAGTLTVIRSANAEDVNTLDNPFNVKPVEQAISLKGKSIKTVLPAGSVSIIKVKAL
jgi:alpha-N-arabinofuranosidase